MKFIVGITSGRCVKALGVGKDVSMQGIKDKSLAEAVKKILGMASRASSRNEILHTDFLTPSVLNESISALENFANVKTITQGGYPQAERCRLSIGNTEILTTDQDVVAALSITGNFGFEHCSHGDFLGSIIGTGIAREKVGDLLLQGKEGAQVLIVPELVEFLIQSLNKVGNVPVSCEQIPLLALDYEPPRSKSFTAVEASLRVDALACLKFTKKTMIKFFSYSSGDVRLNWSPVMKNGTILKTGDVVSVSEKGRLKEDLDECDAHTIIDAERRCGPAAEGEFWARS
ncbi:hypothetical protein KSP40_PGU015524 [Platanthera guangdongensis]|uniref:Ribosome-associated protein quality control protein P2 RNA-binding domain-containing protein n=1 Tax=Platanthera guangdongensis TaxID=2320717 RepID=A0ABR2LUA8_9ASPA